MKIPYETKLETGNLAYVEFVESGRGNNVRAKPGSRNRRLCTVPVGHVVQIVGGPRVAQDMIWWKVFIPAGCGKQRDVTGWTSEGTAQERWLRPIRLVRLVQGDCKGPLGTRLALGERAYVQDPTGRDQGNRIRETPGLDGVRQGLIPVGTALRVLQGPVCRNGMAWWKVRTEGESALRGWTSEGQAGEGFYLVPLEVRRDRPGPIPGGDGQPTFRGDAAIEPRGNAFFSFSPDREVVTILFSDMTVEVPKGSRKGRSQSVSIDLPVDGPSAEVLVEVAALGFVSSHGGAEAAITMQLEGEEQRQTWRVGGPESIEWSFTTTVRAVPSLSTRLSLEIKPRSPRGTAYAALDEIELELHPPRRRDVQARG
jgi:hypothetical protein